MRNAFIAVLWTTVCLIAHGGTTPKQPFYERAHTRFPFAAFSKPAPEKTEPLWFKLAPLIIQELDSTNAAALQRDRFEAPPNPGRKATNNDLPAPAVYWWSDVVQLEGKPHARFAYIWCYPQTKTRSPTALSVQGVRLTLDSSSRPALWEVLADTSGYQLVFAAESVETAAAARFGKPLPGRKFSIETSLRNAPRTVVARVIDDGPVPMGPIVYLSAGSRNPATLICRCMPAQAASLLETSTYCLINLETDSAARDALQKLGHALAFWPGQKDPQPLGKTLRLPPDF